VVASRAPVNYRRMFVIGWTVGVGIGTLELQAINQ
jgi:hypothetical protein